MTSLVRPVLEKEECSRMDIDSDGNQILYHDRPTSLLPQTQDDILPKNQKQGTALILLSCIVVSIANTSVRYATEKLSFDTIFISIFRGMSQFVFVTTLILYYRIRRLTLQLPQKAETFLLIRGLLSSLFIYFKYESLSRLPVGIAVSLLSTTPVFAALFGWIFVREALTMSDILTMAICLFGAILVGASDAPFKMDGQFIGIILALAAGALRAMVFVVIRLLGTKVHFFFSVQASSIGVMVTPFLVQVLRVGRVDKAWEPVGENFVKAVSSTETIVAVICFTTFSFAGSMTLNRGLQLLDAGNSATLRTLDIPLNFLMAFLVIGELPQTLGHVVGCVLVAIGIYMNVNGRKKS